MSRWTTLSLAAFVAVLSSLHACAPPPATGPQGAPTAALPAPPTPPPSTRPATAPQSDARPAGAAPVSRPPSASAAAGAEVARRLAWLGRLQGGTTQATRQLRLESLSSPAVVAALLARDEEPRVADQAFSLVLADRTPRSVALCRAMVQRLEVLGPAQLAALSGPVRPVYWMLSLQGEALARVNEISCEQLVEGLDLTRNNRHGLDNMLGPKLRAIAIRQGQTIDVLWDLSDQPESEFDRAVRMWADIMADDPLVWEPRVGRLRVIEGFRGFLISVGAPLSNIIGMRPAGARSDPRVIRIGG